MLHAVLFEDDDAHADQRQRHMPAHLAFLKANETAIRAAGPLTEGQSPAGGLWLVEAPDAATVQKLIEADPFWPTGLRKSIRILAWHQVFTAS